MGIRVKSFDGVKLVVVVHLAFGFQSGTGVKSAVGVKSIVVVKLVVWMKSFVG